MKKYLLIRTLKSLFSVFCVVTIAVFLVYTQIDREKVFVDDEQVIKLKSKPDTYINYKYNAWEMLGYLDYVKQADMCKVMYDSEADYDICVKAKAGNELLEAAKADYEAQGYTVEQLKGNGYYGYRNYTVAERLIAFYSNMIQIDGKNKVQDPEVPDLERKIYIGNDWNGTPAVMCSGCTHKYLIYFDSSFPFIHQNWIQMNLGQSYPSNKGKEILSVITSGQGEKAPAMVTFPTGVTQENAIKEHSCRYKPVLDALDGNKFTDKYADCDNNYATPSMIALSFRAGILSLILAYVVGLPVGVLMARKKGKLADKLGMVYIVFIIGVPSLAYITFLRYFASTTFGLPSSFSFYGAGEFKSWVLPVVSLALPTISSLMMWSRRYMVDQSTADYVKFAKAKGLSEGEIFTRHILKNAIIPIAHGIPSNIVGTIAGAIITESLYAVPGMGKMLPNAITSFNNSMIVALTFIFTFLSIFAVFAGDLLVTAIDPRISLVNNSKGGRK